MDLCEYNLYVAYKMLVFWKDSFKNKNLKQIYIYMGNRRVYGMVEYGMVSNLLLLIDYWLYLLFDLTESVEYGKKEKDMCENDCDTAGGRKGKLYRLRSIVSKLFNKFKNNEKPGTDWMIQFKYLGPMALIHLPLQSFQ